MSAAILILIAAIYFWRWENSRGETDLTVLPLNGGHAVFVDAAGRKNDWLVDCGNENAVNFTLKNFLRAQGVNKIPRLVLTRRRLRKIAAARNRSTNFSASANCGPARSEFSFRAPTAKSLSEFEKPPSRHKIFNCGDTTGCWQVLCPAATNNFPRADDNALVLLGNFHGTKILLLSDLSRAGQSELLARTNDLRADIVIAGLPNEGEPLCDALIDAIQPKVIVIADSEFPATRRASRALKERLEQKKNSGDLHAHSGAVKIVDGQNRLEIADDGRTKIQSPHPSFRQTDAKHAALAE